MQVKKLNNGKDYVKAKAIWALCGKPGQYFMWLQKQIKELSLSKGHDYWDPSIMGIPNILLSPLAASLIVLNSRAIKHDRVRRELCKWNQDYILSGLYVEILTVHMNDPCRRMEEKLKKMSETTGESVGKIVAEILEKAL